MRLIYFAPVPWDSYEQRPHYFIRDFLRAGGTSVAWINPYPARLPEWRDLMRQDFRDAPLLLSRPHGLEVHTPGGLPIDPLPGGAAVNEMLFWQPLLDALRASDDTQAPIIGVGRPTQLALTAINSLKSAWTFYDAMDDFPEFYSGRSRTAAAQTESAIAAHVSKIFVSSPSLAKKFADAGPPVTLLANAFDMALLPPVSPDLQRPPHAGFIGCMGRWFDWAATVKLANAIAPVPVTLIGPLASAAPGTLPANVTLHPPCSQADAITWLKMFSVGLIPFVRNTLTDGVDPIKYYQYRGAGLPVLSTRFGAMAMRSDRDHTYFVDDDGGAAIAFEHARRDRTAASDAAVFRAENDWSRRFATARIWQAR